MKRNLYHAFWFNIPCCFVQNLVLFRNLAAALSSSCSSVSIVYCDISSLLLWTSLSLCDNSVLYASSNTNERLFDINVVLGRALPEWHVEFFRKLLSFFCGDYLFVEHIALVSNQDLVDVNIGVLLDLGDPVANGLEGTTIGYVVDQEDTLGTTEVGSRDRSETFLPSGIPNLKLDLSSININVLDLEINTDSGDECGTKRIVRITEQETRLSDPGVSDHQKLDLNIVRCTS